MKKLQRNTLKKILLEHFKGNVPIVKEGSEKKELISEIKQKLSTINGFELLKTDKLRYNKPEEVCCFYILSPSQDYSNQYFCMEFYDNKLYINVGDWTSYPIYLMEQIYTLVDKMNLEYKRLETNSLIRQNKKIKEQKINELKCKAITAKINQIAKEDKFYFYIHENTTKVQLLVHLAGHDHIEIDIPYSEFQEILKNLRVTIQTIRDLRDSSGIYFKIGESKYDPEWSYYD
ncbi:MAG: hypothetical protein ABFS56_05040 [Pseudomonadota bacterium]